MKNSPLKISNVVIQPGEKITLAMPTPELYTCAPIYIPIHVYHGKREGPCLLVSGAIHGDEINGVAISQRLLKTRLIGSLKGTLIVIPTMNIYGLMTLSRNLPDRRDLDGSFPGSETGSFASRLADLLTREVFSHITHCIDLHTGEPHISQFPAVRTDLDSEEAAKVARDFAAPIIVNTKAEGGLLWLLHQRGVPTIRFDTGEALRLDSRGIKMGVQGIIRVMRAIGMLSAAKEGTKRRSMELEEVQVVHSASSGLCELFCPLGTFVAKGSRLGIISDPFGTEQKEAIYAPIDGVVLARNNLPIVNEGEPVLRIAALKKDMAETMSDIVETAFD